MNSQRVLEGTKPFQKLKAIAFRVLFQTSDMVFKGLCTHTTHCSSHFGSFPSNWGSCHKRGKLYKGGAVQTAGWGPILTCRSLQCGPRTGRLASLPGCTWPPTPTTQCRSLLALSDHVRRSCSPGQVTEIRPGTPTGTHANYSGKQSQATYAEEKRETPSVANFTQVQSKLTLGILFFLFSLKASPLFCHILDPPPSPNVSNPLFTLCRVGKSASVKILKLGDGDPPDEVIGQGVCWNWVLRWGSKISQALRFGNSGWQGLMMSPLFPCTKDRQRSEMESEVPGCLRTHNVHNIFRITTPSCLRSWSKETFHNSFG